MTRHRVKIEIMLYASGDRNVTQRAEKFWVDKIVKTVQECPGSEQEKKSIIHSLNRQEKNE